MKQFSNKQALLSPPASEYQIEVASEQLNLAVPDSVKSVWNISNGILFNESGIIIYSTLDIVERNITYEVREYAPNLLLVGDDSGGNGFFLSIDESDRIVRRIDYGAIGSMQGEYVAADFLKWVMDGCPLLSLINDSKKAEKVDIVLEKIPKEGMKGMLLIKNKLSLSFSVSQLKDMLIRIPLVILSNVYLSKYEDIVSDVNKTQDCLLLRVL